MQEENLPQKTPEMEGITEATMDEVRSALMEHGDYSRLTKLQRQALLLYLCKQNGLDPSTRPFSYLSIADRHSGKTRVALYAHKSAADGIAKVQKLSDESLEIKDLPGGGAIYVVSVVDDEYRRTGGVSGRRRIAVGVVPPGLTGIELANAHKRAETQAHRRAILSLYAPGILDESELSDIEGVVIPDPELKEAEPAPVEKKKTPVGRYKTLPTGNKQSGGKKNGRNC